jgi:hypothetical protein
MINWHPISTALTDGTFVLLRGGSTNELGMSDDEPKGSAARPVVGKWDGEYWVFAFWDSDWHSVYYNPTEWALIE